MDSKVAITNGLEFLSREQLEELLIEIYMFEVGDGLENAITAIFKVKNLIGNTVKEQLLIE